MSLLPFDSHCLVLNSTLCCKFILCSTLYPVFDSIPVFDICRIHTLFEIVRMSRGGRARPSPGYGHVGGRRTVTGAMSDPGYFGPDSITWEVNRELTVLFGGARALLMHAAHPLIAAGARQTSMYSRDPWARLIRTLMLQSTVTFGSKAEAEEAADKINKLHTKVNGVDPVTGERYDALDHDQLLWVHAALEVSSIYFFERTVRRLTAAERQRYHEESLVAAELILLPRTHVP